ncbi:hypothetical protein AB4144_34820, partial [Rhizobiaceae sp. 2RAB30]
MHISTIAASRRAAELRSQGSGARLDDHKPAAAADRLRHDAEGIITGCRDIEGIVFVEVILLQLYAATITSR